MCLQGNRPLVVVGSKNLLGWTISISRMRNRVFCEAPEPSALYFLSNSFVDRTKSSLPLTVENVPEQGSQPPHPPSDRITFSLGFLTFSLLHFLLQGQKSSRSILINI